MGVDERVSAGGDIRPRRHDAGRYRSIQREHLILLGLDLLNAVLIHFFLQMVRGFSVGPRRHATTNSTPDDKLNKPF
jgi:hypothetical protein